MCLTSNCLLGQTNYSLVKDGKEYQKIIRYLLLNDEAEIHSDGKNKTFNISSEIFKYNNLNHYLDTLYISKLDKSKIVSIRQLVKDELKEHKDKIKLEGYSLYPFPFKH